MTLYNTLIELGAINSDNRASFDEKDAHVIRKVIEDTSKNNELLSNAIENHNYIRHAYTELFLRTLGFKSAHVKSVSIRDDFPKFTNIDLPKLYKDLSGLVEVIALDKTNSFDKFVLRNTFRPLVYANGTFLNYHRDDFKATIGDALYEYNPENVDAALDMYKVEEANANGIDNVLHQLYFRH